MQSFPHDTQVLVVGAGPVGLVAATTLTQLGVQVTLVDAASATHKGARAAVVHSRTLEVLETIGLAKLIIDHGTRVSQIALRGTTRKLLSVDFSLLKEETEFPFMTLISQEVIEKIFADELVRRGGAVHLNKKAIDVRPVENSESVQVAFEDGTSIRAAYVIGADGIHSIVRQSANISYINPFTNQLYDDPNTPHAFNLILADLYFKEPLCEHISPTTFNPYIDNFFFLIPLQTPDDANNDDKPKKFWRVGFGFPNSVELPKRPTQEQIQQLIDDRNPWKSSSSAPIIVSSIITASRYRVRVAQAVTYHAKIGNANILLAGDAAHMHSPVAGQGMNLGICDAVAAAQAIYAHIHSNAASDDEKDAIFTTYSTKRHIVGRRVIGFTRSFTSIVNTHSRWRQFVRNTLLMILGNFKFVRRAVVWRMSGLINRDA